MAHGTQVIETTPVAARELPSYVRWSRPVFRAMAFLFLAGVAVQVFLAGMGVFVGPLRWVWHENFGHILGQLPFLMLILAFVSRQPSRERWLSALAIALIWLQYTFIGIGRSTGIREISALHPVNALFIFWVAILLVRGAARRHDGSR